MKEVGMRAELDARLIDLSREIVELRRKVSRTKGVQKIEGMAMVEQMEHRYEQLAQRLNGANVERPGLGPNLRAEFVKLADLVAGAIEGLISWTDSDYSHSRSDAPHSWS